MAELSLEWIEAGSLRTQKIGLNSPTKQPGVTRIGRDPSRCDIVLSDGSVSGLHVEIGYDLNTQGFYIQNLRDSNPPIINNELLASGRRPLLAENIIQLGNLQIRANVTIASTPTPNAIPATELQSFNPVSTPPEPTFPNGYAPPESPQYYPQSNHKPFLEQTPLHQAVSLSQNTSHNRQSSKFSFRFLALGIILVGLFALAWPNIRGFLGIGSSTTSQTSDPPVQDSAADSKALSIADRELFSHSSGLFDLEIPRNWTSIDNSRPQQVVIQAWRHPSLNAFIIMRIFSIVESLNDSELQAQSQQLVDDLFGELDQFRRSEPEILRDGTVRILWEGDQGDDTLLAATFTRQDGLNVSALTLWAPATLVDRQFEDNVTEIVSSWEVAPDLEIP